MAGIESKEAANIHILDVYLREHNARFAKPPELEDSAFVRISAFQSLIFKQFPD